MVHQYIIQKQKNTTNEQPRQKTTEDRKKTRSSKSRRSFRVYLTFYIFVQQEEI